MDEPARCPGPRKLLPHVMSENFLQGTELAVSGVLGAADLGLYGELWEPRLLLSFLNSPHL